MKCLGALALALIVCGPARAEVDLVIGWLRVEVPRPPTLSDLDTTPADIGLAGARVALEENRTTGRFLGQSYELLDASIAVDGDVTGIARDLLAATPFLVIDAPADTLLALADLPEATGAILFNTSASDLFLRDTECRANLLHTAPSHAMRTDALAQFLVLRRWSDVVMVAGTYPDDVSYADAMRRSLTKFGLRLRQEKTWAFDADMRRAAAQEIPLFTQDFGEYQALLVADEVHDFGRYLLYNSWMPRPVMGSEGLSALAWSPVIEQWGAAQLQNRFRESAGRGMQARDYAAWAAVRTLGEAVTRTSSGDPQAVRSYILSDAFELAGFKGRPLSYRDWNGQLRQPIALAHPRALVATAPLDGFLHQTNEMDSLGLDRPESRCKAFE